MRPAACRLPTSLTGGKNLLLAWPSWVLADAAGCLVCSWVLAGGKNLLQLADGCGPAYILHSLTLIIGLSSSIADHIPLHFPCRKISISLAANLHLMCSCPPKLACSSLPAPEAVACEILHGRSSWELDKSHTLLLQLVFQQLP